MRRHRLNRILHTQTVLITIRVNENWAVYNFGLVQFMGANTTTTTTKPFDTTLQCCVARTVRLCGRGYE